MNGCKNCGTDCRDNNSPFDPCIGCPCYVPEDEEEEYYNPYEDENYKVITNFNELVNTIENEKYSNY